jgi:hypothetical protein
MKKLIFAAIAISIAFASCKTTQVAKFTSVENLYKLPMGSNYEEIVRQLGSSPYNILSTQVDGYTIYTYKYKTVERKVSPKLINERGGETAGTEVYNGKENTVYLMVKGGKLESFVTSEGRGDSQALVMLNNTLYTISQDKGKYIIVPTEIKAEKTESLNPLVNRKKK